MTLNVVANAPQTFGISRADRVIHPRLLVAYSPYRAAVNLTDLAQCGITDSLYESVCVVSTEFQSLSLHPEFQRYPAGLRSGEQRLWSISHIDSTGRIFKHIRSSEMRSTIFAQRYPRIVTQRFSALYRRAAAVPGRQIRRLAFCVADGPENPPSLSRQNRGRTQIAITATIAANFFMITFSFHVVSESI